MADGTLPPLARRKFLLGATVTAAGAFAEGKRTVAEQPAGERAPPLKIIDFHNHYVGPNFPVATLASAPPALRSYWEGVNRNLSDPGSLMSSIEQSGIAARVINTPTAFLEDADGNVPSDMIPRINDAVADLVSRNAGRLYGLATVDAYAGETAARELTRAVKELGLRGVFVESAKRDLLPDAPQARPDLRDRRRARGAGIRASRHRSRDAQPVQAARETRGAAGARQHQCGRAGGADRERRLRRDTQPAGRGDDAGARRRPARRAASTTARGCAATRPRQAGATSTSTPWGCTRFSCARRSICSAPITCWSAPTGRSRWSSRCPTDCGRH